MPLSRMILRTQSHWWVFTKQTYCHFTISYRLIPIAMARIIKFLSLNDKTRLALYFKRKPKISSVSDYKTSSAWFCVLRSIVYGVVSMKHWRSRTFARCGSN